MKNIMRHLVASVLVCTAMTASAQLKPNIAAKIYNDCVLSQVRAVSELEPTRVAIHEFVFDVDVMCQNWTVIWYKPITGEDFRSLSDKHKSDMNAQRLILLQSVLKKLRAEAMIR